MKKILMFFVAVVCMSNVANAQTVEVYKNGRLQLDVFMADSVNFKPLVMPTREEAGEWAKAHLDSLVDVAWNMVVTSEEPNKRDPDATREVFRTIGYNGKNVYTYTLAGEYVDSVILERLIDKAVKEGKLTAVLISGNSGAGKSYSIRENPEVQKLVQNAGVVLDEVFNDRARLVKIIERLKKAGITEQTVVLVHNDAKSSMINSLDRYFRSGRVIGLKFLLSLYDSYVGYVKFLEDNQVGTRRFYLENAGNSTGGIVSVAKALEWDYSVTPELKAELTSKLFDYVIECRKNNTISPRDLWAIILDE